MTNCNTCKAASWVLDCHWGWPCGVDPDACEYHAKRETPLLVDVLAEVLEAVQDEDKLSELVALGKDYFNESMLTLLDRVFPQIGSVLTRYQKEAGGASKD